MPLSAAEQYMLELINRARLDPLAEAQRYNLDLNADLPSGTISTNALQVLAPNEALSTAATAHSEWMIEEDVFSHTGENASTAGERMEDAGYQFTGQWSWRENLAWIGSTGSMSLSDAIDSHHEGLYRSEGHRTNTFAASASEIGIGQVGGDFTQDGRSYNSSMLTENFASSGTSTFVTGVAYMDSDSDDFYSIGEGRGDVWLVVNGDRVTTADSGGYSADVGTANSASVSLGIGGSTLADIDIDLSSGNAKVDLVADASGQESLSLSASTTLKSGIGDATLLGIANLSLTGNNDSNELTGNRGANSLIGLGGRDDLYGYNGNDELDGGGSNDRLFGMNGNDILIGRSGDDRLWGGSGNDRMWGDDQNDQLDGQGGNDTLSGGNGADDLMGRSGEDSLSGGAGRDRLWGGDDDDRLDGQGGNDRMFGGSGADDLIGRGGNDTLLGGGARDRLWGGLGNDIMDGQAGNDRMVGGGGADTFIFSAGNDTVVDFQDDVDTILLRGSVLNIDELTLVDILEMGTIDNGNAYFDFGDGNKLTLIGVDDLDVLANDLMMI